MKNRFLNVEYKKHPSWKNGLKFARFKYSYIKKLKRYCRVKNREVELNIFLNAFLSGYGSTISRDGFCFMNETTVEYIKKHIRYFKNKGKWRLVK